MRFTQKDIEHLIELMKTPDTKMIHKKRWAPPSTNYFHQIYQRSLSKKSPSIEKQFCDKNTIIHKKRWAPHLLWKWAIVIFSKIYWIFNQHFEYLILKLYIRNVGRHLIPIISSDMPKNSLVKHPGIVRVRWDQYNDQLGAIFTLKKPHWDLPTNPLKI